MNTIRQVKILRVFKITLSLSLSNPIYTLYIYILLVRYDLNSLIYFFLVYPLILFINFLKSTISYDIHILTINTIRQIKIFGVFKITLYWSPSNPIY